MAAGNHGSGISRGLGREIIGRGMNNNRTPNNFASGKSIGKYRHKRMPIVSKQRRKVPRVCGVATVVRVIMASDVGEGLFGSSRARTAFVDMKTKNSRRTIFCALGKTFDMRDDQHPRFGLIKIDNAFHRRIGGASCNVGKSVGRTMKRNFIKSI